MPGMTQIDPGAKTTVHLMRHGEVYNPQGVLYGRMPGFHLSELGRKMAERGAEFFADRDVVAVIASPLDRAQETAAPIAEKLSLDVRVDGRLIEASNTFEGKRFSVGDGVLKRPAVWPKLYNPFKPSWGEPYTEQVARVRQAVEAARDLAAGHEAVCVSHQLPIWVTRLAAEHRRLWHDPRKRECSLASVTSFVYVGSQLVGIEYREPAKDLLPVKTTKKFVAGA
jgi:broad specificity phosphatase PhoE